MNLKQLLLLFALLVATCLLSFSLFAQPTTVGLVCHFKLDGNTTNSGPANVTATPISTSYTTNNANASNKALQFAGNLNSYIDFADNGNLDFTGATNFTISFSFFFNGSSTGGLIDNCLNYNGWGVWLWSTVAGVWNLQFNYRNNSVGSAAATNFTPGVWHHVAAVRNNGTISLYIDGAFRLSATEGTGTPSYPINMIAGAFAYGSFSPPRYNPFGGKIDEIRIYNRALSAAEIAVLTPYSLPLKMGEFTAVKKTTGVLLNWETLSEQNTAWFDVERSTDGVNYTSIGRVNAAGNSSDRKQYQFTDANPVAGTAFYRLKMTDLDNSSTYSRVIVIKNAQADNITLFPNPAKDVLQLQISSDKKEQATLLITGIDGRIHQSRAISLQDGQNAVSLPVYTLSPGNYYLTLVRQGRRDTQIFTRQ